MNYVHIIIGVSANLKCFLNSNAFFCCSHIGEYDSVGNDDDVVYVLCNLITEWSAPVVAHGRSFILFAIMTHFLISDIFEKVKQIG